MLGTCVRQTLGALIMIQGVYLGLGFRILYLGFRDDLLGSCVRQTLGALIGFYLRFGLRI